MSHKQHCSPQAGSVNVSFSSTGGVGAGAFFQEPIPYGPYPGTDLPRTGTFTVLPAKLVLMRVASSAWRATVPDFGVVEVLVDGAPVGTIALWFNQANEHHDLVPRTLNLTGLAPGAHTVELVPAAGTTVDAQDLSQVVVEQYPL